MEQVTPLLLIRSQSNEREYYPEFFVHPFPRIGHSRRNHARNYGGVEHNQNEAAGPP